MKNKILKPLPKLYKDYRKTSSNESEQTISAQTLTKEWQKQIVKEGFIKAEVEITLDANERIDIIDFESKTAYEIKVSGKNIHHEFYKDIFKVLVYRQNFPEKEIDKFVFISEQSGIETLKKSKLYSETLKLVNKLTNDKFEITVEGIIPE